MTSEDNEYQYTLLFKDEHGNIVLSRASSSKDYKTFIVPQNSVYLEYGIGEFDGNGNVIPHRSTDYTGYSLWIEDITLPSIREDLEYLKSKVGVDIDVLNIQKWADLKFLFFSDVHAGWNNVQKIVDYAEALGAENCDCIINGGDTVANLISDGVSGYNSIVDETNIPILTVAGNHDCWISGWEWASQTDVYNLITAKVKEQVPSIVQPADAATNGFNYYYKDFGNIRIICLLAMQSGENTLYFDSTQQTWLSNVLEDARTTYKYYDVTSTSVIEHEYQEGDVIKGTVAHLSELNNRSLQNGIYRVPMSVVIVTHAPYRSSYEEVSEKSCSWLTMSAGCKTKSLNFDSLKISDAVLSIVNSYIENGGAFITWLTGHSHSDRLISSTLYNGQLMVNIASANYAKHIDGATISDPLNLNYNLFDYIGVDTKSGMIKCLRIGWAQDSSMRTRRSWCYDYVNGKLLSEN